MGDSSGGWQPSGGYAGGGGDADTAGAYPTYPASWFSQPNQSFQPPVQSFGEAGSPYQSLWQQPEYPVSPYERAMAEYKHFPSAAQFNLGIDPDYDFTADIERMNWLAEIEAGKYPQKKIKDDPFGRKSTNWKQLTRDLKVARMINDAFYDQPASLHGYWGRSVRDQYADILPDEPYRFPNLGQYIKNMRKSDYYQDYSDLLGGNYYKDYLEDLPQHDISRQPSYLR